jgi:hypothetical protein
MSCNCGKSSGNPAATYVIRKVNGQVQEFTNKVAADIEVTKGGKVIEIKQSGS